VAILIQHPIRMRMKLTLARRHWAPGAFGD